MHRDPVPSGKQRRATGVVAVGVCDDHGPDARRRHPDAIQPPSHLSIAQPHVDQHPLVAALQQGGIPRAPAAKYRQTDPDDSFPFPLETLRLWALGAQL